MELAVPEEVQAEEMALETEQEQEVDTAPGAVEETEVALAEAAVTPQETEKRFQNQHQNIPVTKKEKLLQKFLQIEMDEL